MRALVREDVTTEAEVRHRLAVYGGFDRWTVRVDQGAVTVDDELDDPVDRNVTTALALAVPGVREVRVRGTERAGGGADVPAATTRPSDRPRSAGDDPGGVGPMVPSSEDQSGQDARSPTPSVGDSDDEGVPP
ncbi:hypothetical protein [Streptoalloteichus hindustanus]|uniref:BON domain-containing protein n=1 Tax=Streptoalloteichus hindustanus TaxID=2017 RepID=A0A1M5DRY1_STRHI|nr:hypothetical protein [Streptoalloteichus hindustanus]SHF69757.1 hypothetical protein SAMN05444320_104581 [Streptoalloteichus hindustanus]